MSGTMSVRASNEQWDELIAYFDDRRQKAARIDEKALELGADHPGMLLAVARREPRAISFIRHERRERKELFG